MSERSALWSGHVWFLVYHGACNAPQREWPPASELTGREGLVRKGKTCCCSFVFCLPLVGCGFI